jgi:hypothetical protein
MEEAQIMEQMNKRLNRFSLAEDAHKPLPPLAKQDAAKMQSPTCKEYHIIIFLKICDTIITAPSHSAEMEKSPKLQMNPTTLSEDIQKRKEYLCRQRDKLLQAKGKSKASKEIKNEPNIKEQEEELVHEIESDEAIQIRRALVNRLKAEIINKK